MNLITSVVMMAASTMAVQDGYVIESTIQQEQPAPVVTPLDYTTAYENAQQGDKPLLILVTAEWCPPCQLMKTTTIPQLMARDSFEGFHYATVDLDREQALARQLIGERGVPQLIMYEKQDGRWLRRYLRGMQTPEQVEAFVAQAQVLRTAEADSGTVDK
ncbi:MAG: thioredoxin family protein [Planctomycetota bacterium]